MLSGLSWLAVVHRQVTDATDDRLTLDTGTSGVAFTDRPERAVRLFDIPTWVELAWAEDGSFVADPPNASLVDETENAIAIVEIAGASWVDEDLQVNVTYLGGEPPAVGDSVALTVDDGGAPMPYT